MRIKTEIPQLRPHLYSKKKIIVIKLKGDFGSTSTVLMDGSLVANHQILIFIAFLIKAAFIIAISATKLVSNVPKDLDIHPEYLPFEKIVH